MKPKLNFDILESLRGLAALYVCIGHSRAILWIGGDRYLQLHPRETLDIFDYFILGLNMLTRLSTEFVIIFFVLSGFSIAYSLRNNQEALPFYKRRFVRLYPPYIAAIFWAMLVMLVIQALLPSFVNGTYRTAVFDRLASSRQLFSWKVFFQNLIYLPQLDGILRPFWSLTMEVIFYMLAPFLFRSRTLYYTFSILLFLVAMGARTFNWPLHFILAEFCFYSIFFAIGVTLYDNYAWVLQRGKLFLTSKTIWISIGLFLIMIVISLLGYSILNAFVAAFMSAILIIYLLSNNREIKWLIGIGRFSYTLYITHYPTIFLYLSLYYILSKATPPYIYINFLFIPCIFLCLGIAYVQYLLVEKRSKVILDLLRKKSSSDSQDKAYVPGTTEIKAEKTNW
jgi:peptidoglycan/LPS O-acetylase OafA/YrhL